MESSNCSFRVAQVATPDSLGPQFRMLCSHQRNALIGGHCVFWTPEGGMTPWQQWVQRPRSLWVRKALFQIHLWVGIGVGLYVAVISISGSAIVFDRELGRTFHRTVVVADSGRPRMRIEEVEQSARRAYPAYQVLSVGEPERLDQPATIVLERGNKRTRRLLDPYTGADLGDPRSGVERVLGWLADLHDNLLTGFTGRTVNGIGALLVTLMSCTGAVLWWPGIRNWRRGVTINWSARFARWNWDVHSAVGFWCSLFVLIWGISGIYLCFPGVLDSLLGGEFRLWIVRLHFGQFNGATEALWTILGLAPTVLAGTGALMWWNRVLSKKVRRSRNKRTGAALEGDPHPVGTAGLFRG
jgi:uncharacterized iron-regulated membrane protein